MLESTYEECLAVELASRNLTIDRQLEIPIIYKGQKLSAGYRIDLLVNGKVILELKSVQKIDPIHEAQLLTYLRLSDKKIGLLLNFNVPVMRHGIKRFVN